MGMSPYKPIATKENFAAHVGRLLKQFKTGTLRKSLIEDNAEPYLLCL